jgi:hypothetical protein
MDLSEARIDTGTPEETDLPPDEEAADDVGRPPRSQ